VRQPHATDDRGLHRVVFLALLPLGLASTPDSATGTTEGACRSAALTWATTTTAATTGTTAEATGGSSATGTGTSACTGTAATAAVVTAASTAAGTTTG
jgi:hypothetical protein